MSQDLYQAFMVIINFAALVVAPSLHLLKSSN